VIGSNNTQEDLPKGISEDQWIKLELEAKKARRGYMIWFPIIGFILLGLLWIGLKFIQK
jgi:hypothetical protein